jgi:hypothetical protein
VTVVDDELADAALRRRGRTREELHAAMIAALARRGALGA